MLKNLLLVLLSACIAFKGNADVLTIDSNSMPNILKIKDRQVREKKLVSYVKQYLQTHPVDSLSSAKSRLNTILGGIENHKAFEYFTEAMYQRRLMHMDDAEAAMLKAIKYAGVNGDHYLVFTFLSHLAFIQTDEGNAIEAVTSYGLAKKEALTLNDPLLQQQINVNLSDVYYKNNFYNQSLFYLNEAEALTQKYGPNDVHINKIIYYNKAENFFRMNKPDSLKKYCDKLKAIKGNIYKLYTYQKRTEYYLYLLQYDFERAVRLIKAMQTDSLYKYNDQDQQNLADAYFNGGHPDSAVRIINELLDEPLEVNHPEIKYHLYKVLGQIAEGNHNPQLADYNFKMALEQSEDVINRLTQVGSISSQIQIDELAGSYLQKDERYKRERLWLIFAVVVALLIVAIVTLFYRSARQKRHYQKLLFTAQKEELAFINSHEVRKHLSNILGIIDIIKNSDNREREYYQFEDHLFGSAESMDHAIKSISAKLDEQIPDRGASVYPAGTSTNKAVPLTRTEKETYGALKTS
ncbi:MAG: hypothetical protein M3O71_29335 [Bacteroidota bacterium]|nr:hypothetical protein [Bacteroidota bacterium]